MFHSILFGVLCSGFVLLTFALRLGEATAGGIVTSLGVGRFGECVSIGMRSLVDEVEDSRGIYSISHVTGFKVEVWACTTAGISAECDGIAGFHNLIGLNQSACEVAVNSLKAVGVTQDHIIAIAFSLIISETNFSVKGSPDCIFHPDAYVDTLVHTAELGTVAVIGGNLTAMRNAISRNVDHFAVGNVLLFEWVNAFGVPAFGVDVELRLNIIDQVDVGVLFNQFDLVLGLALRGQQLLVHLRVGIF